MAFGAAQIAVLALGVLSVGLSALAIRWDEPLSWEWAAPVAMALGGAPYFETVLDYTVDTGIAHAPAVILTDAGVSILWFAGSREAQPDVEVVGVDIAA